MTVFVGIDIAKYTHYASFVSSNGEVLFEPFPFDNSSLGFQSLLSKLEQFPIDEVIIGYESTAHYHLNLHQFLQRLSFTSFILNPLLTKRFRGLQIRDVKNDKMDSLCIAQFLSFNHSNKFSHPAVNDLLVLCTELHSLKQKKTQCYIQLTACLDVVFPELKQQFFKGNLKSNAAHNLLKVYCSAHDIKNVRIDRLTNIISVNSRGFQKKRVESLKLLATNSIGINSSGYKFKVSNLIEQIECIERQIERLIAVINEMIFEMDCAILKIPGMGTIQAAYILSVINSIDRFSHPKQVLAYAGLDPKIRQSGTFEAKSTRMSKRGNALLRYALIWSAHNVVKNSKTMNDYYLKKRSEGKSHYNALGHCSRKLVNYIFWIMNHPDEEFILE